MALTQHHQPLGFLNTIRVVLGITELSNVDCICLRDFICSAVTDENGLSAPFDGDITTLGDVVEVDLHLGQGQDISRGRHVGQKVRDGRLGSKEGHSSCGADHKV